MLVQEFFPNDERFNATHAVVWALYKALELNVGVQTPPQLSNATIARYTRLSPRTVSKVRNELSDWGYELKPFILTPTIAPPAIAPRSIAGGARPAEKPKREKKEGASSFAYSGFILDDVAIAYYLQKIPGGNVTEEFERFVNYHESKGSKFASWIAAWRNWVLNSKTFAAERKTGSQPISSTYKGIEV